MIIRFQHWDNHEPDAENDQPDADLAPVAQATP